jgi:pectinesterase
MTRAYTFVLLFLLGSPCAPASEPLLCVRVKNTMPFARKSETIAVPVSKVHDFPGLKGVGVIRVRERHTGKELTTQREGGEVLFQTDLKPNEAKEFLLDGAVADRDTILSKVEGDFFPPREDYAWENDRIAFRVYGPALAKEVNNGIDVWCKRVRSLVVREWYKASENSPPGHDAYHEDRGEGADFFEVGRSLGAGGNGIWYHGKVRQPGVFTSWRTIASGPIRVTFELTYASWVVGGDSLIERETISLDAGQNLNTITVIFDGRRTTAELNLVCGLVKRNNVQSSYDSAGGWMSLWGSTNADAVNGSLGTAVVLPADTQFKFWEDSLHTLMIVPLKIGMRLTYYAGAGWTRSGDFSSEDSWCRYLKNFAEARRHPVVLSYEVVQR